MFIHTNEKIRKFYDVLFAQKNNQKNKQERSSFMIADSKDFMSYNKT